MLWEMNPIWAGMEAVVCRMTASCLARVDGCEMNEAGDFRRRMDCLTAEATECNSETLDSILMLPMASHLNQIFHKGPFVVLS